MRPTGKFTPFSLSSTEPEMSKGGCLVGFFGLSGLLQKFQTRKLIYWINGQMFADGCSVIEILCDFAFRQEFWFEPRF